MKPSERINEMILKSAFNPLSFDLLHPDIKLEFIIRYLDGIIPELENKIEIKNADIKHLEIRHLRLHDESRRLIGRLEKKIEELEKQKILKSTNEQYLKSHPFNADSIVKFASSVGDYPDLAEVIRRNERNKLSMRIDELENKIEQLEKITGEIDSKLLHHSHDHSSLAGLAGGEPTYEWVNNYKSFLYNGREDDFTGMANPKEPITEKEEPKTANLTFDLVTDFPESSGSYYPATKEFKVNFSVIGYDEGIRKLCLLLAKTLESRGLLINIE